MNKNLLILCLLLVTLGSKGQVEQLARFEIVHKSDLNDYVVISTRERGALILELQHNNTDKTYPVLLHNLDTNLKEQWVNTIQLNRQFDIRGYHHDGATVYLLFQDSQYGRQIKIISVGLENQEITEYDPKTIVELDLQEFEVIQNHVIIGGYIQDRPAVFAYDLKNNKVRTLSNVFQNNSELLEIRINSDKLTFNVLSSRQNLRKDRTISVNTYDYAGNPIRDYELVIDKDIQLLNGVSSSIKDKEQLVVGLYCFKAGTFPSGIFINHVDKHGVQTMKYHNFGKFKTFLNHEGEKRAQRMKEKAMKAEEQDKDWRYKIDGLFSEMFENEDTRTIAAEFFVPVHMRTSDYMRSRSGINPFSSDNYSNAPRSWLDSDFNRNLGTFEFEFDFTHAFALSIDLKGNIIWDNSMEIDEEKEGYLSNMGAFEWDGQDLFYSYYFEEKLFAKKLTGDSEKHSDISLMLKNELETLSFERASYRGSLGWFDNKFLIHGLQTIKAQQLGGETRDVFFVNAISIIEESN